MNPRVSIGLPVYNGQQYLRQALESLLAQTFGDFEIIVSDNASTDDTQTICQQFLRADRRIQYHRFDKNRGAVENFNHVARLANGPYFKWAAADDICQPRFLECLVPILDRHAEVLWCHTQSALIDPEGQVLTETHPLANGPVHSTASGLPRLHHDSPRRDLRFRSVLLGTTWCADCYGLIRMDALRQTCLLPACFGAEKVLIGALSLLGQYREHPETLFYQRIHASTAGNISKAAEQMRYVLGDSRHPFYSTRWTLFRSHIASVRSVPMPLVDRIRCWGVLTNYLLQWRKWGLIVRESITGRGVGKKATKIQEAPIDELKTGCPAKSTSK